MLSGEQLVLSQSGELKKNYHRAVGSSTGPLRDSEHAVGTDYMTALDIEDAAVETTLHPENSDATRKRHPSRQIQADNFMIV